MRIRLIHEADTGNLVAKFWSKPSVEQRDFQKSQPSLSRFRQFHSFAGELVPITKEDMDSIRVFANGAYDSGLTILGFKPRSSVPFYHSITSAYLILPSDIDVQGSANAFAQLRASMLRKNVVAIGEVLHRETWQSRLVAIVPIEDSSSSDDLHVPPGMFVMSLPFEDDIRAVVPDEASKEFSRIKSEPSPIQSGVLIKEEYSGTTGDNVFGTLDDEDEAVTGNVASEELVSAAIKLTKKQGLNKLSLAVDFDNAALIEFYAYLKHIALDLPHEEVDEFGTAIDEKKILVKAGDEIKAFLNCLPTDVHKAKATTSRKRAKDLPPDDSGVNWMELIENKTVDTCKVDQLKKRLKSLGMYVCMYVFVWLI